MQSRTASAARARSAEEVAELVRHEAERRHPDPHSQSAAEPQMTEGVARAAPSSMTPPWSWAHRPADGTTAPCQAQRLLP
jgi:hypothetical protein